MKLKRTIKWKIADRILIYGFITWLEKVKGITSIVGGEQDKHYILWDFDNIDLNKVIESLIAIFHDYKLDGIVIFSDKEESYRALSLNIVDFKTLLKILLDTDGIDRMFFKWTVRRGYATIRLTEKKGRIDNKIIYEIGNIDKELVKEKFKFVEYETDKEVI